MKVIVSSLILAFAIGGVAALILGSIQKPADVAFATSGTRVGTSTTTHMVGPNWTGLDDK